MRATFRLIWQDPARIGLVRAVLTCLAIGLLFRMVPDLGDDIGGLAADDLPGGFVPFYLLLTALVATFVLGSNAWTRSSRLALSLPLSTHRVWTVRTACLVGVGLISVVALAVTMGLSVDLAGKYLAMNPVIALAAARSGAVVVLMFFLFQLPQGERDRIPITAPYVVYVLFVGTITLLFSAGRILSIEGTLVFFAIALILGIWLRVRLPASFSIGPTVSESLTPDWSSSPDVRANDEPRLLPQKEDVDRAGCPSHGLNWFLFRGLRGNILTWVFLFIIGASAAVVAAEFLDGTNAFLPFFMMAIYLLPVVQVSLDAMPPFDSLPIPRRVLWAHIFVPIMLSMALGAGVSLLVFAVNPRPFSQVGYVGCCIEVPWDYLELSRDGQAQTVISAWGESFTPTTYPVWHGLPIVLYDPFEVGPESSPRFVELQLRRAAEAVYGISVPQSLTEPDYEAQQTIQIGADRGAFIVEETRGHLSADRNRSAAVALGLLTVVGTVFILLALVQFGSSVHRKVFKWVLRGFLGLIVVTGLAIAVARVVGLTEIWYVGALASIGIRSLSHWLPLPTWVLWLLCVSSWVGSYLLLERAFSSIEIPREKTMNRFAEEY